MIVAFAFISKYAVHLLGSMILKMTECYMTGLGVCIVDLVVILVLLNVEKRI